MGGTESDPRYAEQNSRKHNENRDFIRYRTAYQAWSARKVFRSDVHEGVGCGARDGADQHIGGMYASSVNFNSTKVVRAYCIR